MKEGAPLRAKAVPGKVRAYGPGLEPTGVVAKAPANFTVETFGAGDGELTITVNGPNGVDYKVDKVADRKKNRLFACSYYPDKEGEYVVTINFQGRAVPNSPWKVLVEGFAGDANKVSAAGPGLEADGVVANKPTYFDIFTAGAGKGTADVVVLDPAGRKDTVPAKITPGENDTFRNLNIFFHNIFNNSPLARLLPYNSSFSLAVFTIQIFCGILILQLLKLRNSTRCRES